MPAPNRRDWMYLVGGSAASGLVTSGLITSGWGFPELGTRSALAADQRRKFTMDLCPGRIGVKADQTRAIELAHQFGFESVEPLGWSLEKEKPQQLAEMPARLSEKKLVWGAAGLPVEFRQDESTFQRDLKALPQAAKVLQTAGVTRVGTWLRPSHDTLTYRQNFQQHVRRLQPVAKVLAEHGLRFGLEYVGPRTSWTSQRYAFIHTMAETQELLHALKSDNVGLVLDSWHWYTAEEDVSTLQSLDNHQIVAVDLNDAPSGLAVDQQIDNRRELPAQTGVIDVKQFLASLLAVGYDGPIRAEPFNQPLNALDDEPAVDSTARALRQAFQLVE